MWKKTEHSEVLEFKREYLDQAICFVLKKIDENMKIFGNKFPAPASYNNVYLTIENIEWTSSFWSGMLWLAYDITGNPKYRTAASDQLESYKKRVDGRIFTDTHDLGFLYTLSCVASYRLTKDESAKDTAVAAAHLLVERYFEKAGIIQAWGNLNDPAQRGRMIIDCLMNLPLLYWASLVTGDKRFRQIAERHAMQSARHLIRDDGSCYHTFYMDVETGMPKFGRTQQGFSDDSCWARGQAWAIYGFVLSYLYTKDDKFLDISKKVADYFMSRLTGDLVCRWDLAFTEGDEEKDSSAAAIACCGMLEIAKQLRHDDPYRTIYRNSSLMILSSLIGDYVSSDQPASNGVLLHGVYNKPEGNGVDECCIWGDYFYFESLVRLYKDWTLYW
jgi:unsaturated chondroitin disaccharide hydrolase